MLAEQKICGIARADHTASRHYTPHCAGQNNWRGRRDYDVRWMSLQKRVKLGSDIVQNGNVTRFMTT